MVDVEAVISRFLRREHTVDDAYFLMSALNAAEARMAYEYGRRDEIIELRKALELIRDNGGAVNAETGLRCNGTWCAEQARAALAERETQ